MPPIPLRALLVFFATVIPSSCLAATFTSLQLSAPQAADRSGFPSPQVKGEAGPRFGVDSQSLLLDGKRVIPVMGECHYSRMPQESWRDSLLRMKAGGITVVSTYVFWNHHEASQGQWDWSGRNNLGAFIDLCAELDLMVAVRIGPWCHGEVRNGGLPDWLLETGCKVRTDDPVYLGHVARLYEQIGRQVQGRLWQAGGPIVAVQIENEYGGEGSHLMQLRELALQSGINPPVFTRTGWPMLRSGTPFGSLLPLFGAYAEGFWDRELTSMPGRYWAAFRFSPVRTDAAIANEQLGARAAEDEADAHRYPYLTCELGGGMMSSYHRRIDLQPEDLSAVALCKLGSGGNLPGYYMYHGGVNPSRGLQENQSTRITNWNDMPELNYDFNAPLGAWGQVRSHYHLLRRFHLFVADYGEQLAGMPARFPVEQPLRVDDYSTLRWAVRSNGEGGFLFINNHHRGHPMNGHEAVQFELNTAGGSTLVMPTKPIAIPSGLQAIWPFGLELAPGLVLRHATVQALCRIEEAGVVTHFMEATPGVAPELVLTGVLNASGPASALLMQGAEGLLQVSALSPGRECVLELQGGASRVRLVVLTREEALSLWKGRLRGRDRVVLSQTPLVFEKESLTLRAAPGAEVSFAVYPAIGYEQGPVGWTRGALHGVFQSWSTKAPGTGAPLLRPHLERQAGEAPPVRLGACPKPVAAAPGDEAFAAAGVWLLPMAREGIVQGDLLRLAYRGDVLRLWSGEHLLWDDFSNGQDTEFDLWAHRHLLPEHGMLRVEILPFGKDTPVMRPKACGAGDAALLKAEIVRQQPLFF